METFPSRGTKYTNEPENLQKRTPLIYLLNVEVLQLAASQHLYSCLFSFPTTTILVEEGVHLLSFSHMPHCSLGSTARGVSEVQPLIACYTFVIQLIAVHADIPKCRQNNKVCWQQDM